MAGNDADFLRTLREQLAKEVQGDSDAVADRLRSEFSTGTTELTGKEAEDYLQQTWLEGKGLRNVEEIDRMGPKRWFDAVFEHIGVNVTPLGKDIFFQAIEAGVDYVDAVRYATVLGDIPIEHAPSTGAAMPPEPGPVMVEPPMPAQPTAPAPMPAPAPQSPTIAPPGGGVNAPIL